MSGLIINRLWLHIVCMVYNKMSFAARIPCLSLGVERCGVSSQSDA